MKERSQHPPFRVLCFGSRGWCSNVLVEHFFGVIKPEVVVVREARGADQMCRRVARRRRIPVVPFRVEHDKDGPWPDAGKNANGRMLRDGGPINLGIGFVIGAAGTRLTPGSRDMAEKILGAGVPVMLVRDGGAVDDELTTSRLARGSR